MTRPRAVLRASIVLLSIWVSPEQAAPQGDCDRASTTAILQCLLENGRYAEAEDTARRWRASVTQQFGNESVDTAEVSDYLVKALVGGGKGGQPATLALADSAVKIRIRLRSGTSSLDVSLDNLATVYVEHTLDGLAQALLSQERFNEAKSALERSRTIRERKKSSLPALARTLALTALLHKYDGQYATGLGLTENALTLLNAAGPLHPHRSTTLQIRGDLLFLSGDIAGAERAWTDALDVAQRTVGLEHPLTLLLMRELAASAKAAGNLPRARQLLETVAGLAKSALARCHPETTYELNDLANLLEYDGDYRRSRALYTEALSISEECFGRSHSQTATIVHNQAVLSLTTGDYAEAQRLEQRALRIWSTNLGARHPYIARVLDVLAEIASARGDVAAAENFYKRALAIRQKAGGPDSPDVAWTLTNLATVAYAAGQTRVALDRVNAATAIYDRNVGEQPDHRANAFVLRGKALLRRGEFPPARDSFNSAINERTRVFGAAHPLTASARADLALSEFALGSVNTGAEDALAAEQVGRDQLRFTIRYMPERQAMAYAAARPRGLDLALSMAVVERSLDPARLLDAAIRSRGVILDELAGRAQSASGGGDPALAVLDTAVLAARQRFATLMVRSLDGADAASTRLLEDARQQKEDAERALAERSAAAREETQRAQIGLDEVRRALPAGSALVSFVRYERTSVLMRSSRPTVTTSASYAAFITRAESDEVRFIPLGSASSLERLVDAWRAEAGGRSIATGLTPRDAERRYRAAAAALRARIWDPLDASLAGATRIFIVPDASLNLVTFAAFPAARGYLVETGVSLHYLTTERDLVRTSGPSGQGLLALGGPSFGGETTTPPAAAARGSGCGSIGSLHFDDLPGTRAEVHDIASIWGNPRDVVVLSGRAATKAALTSAIAGHRVVHLATHGFFLRPECEAALPTTRGVGGLISGRAPAAVDNPLLLSGLALAGVNALSGARQSDGILNAEEIAGLNLQGTEWAVLSACDTGLGQITAGEGVFGLRRALQIAGVHTIIMSLWSVEDQATREWMKALYEARLAQRLDTPGAVRAASLQTLRQRRAKGQSTHPFYWAAFVAAGDWR
ncbi:MAG: hypothetical protein DMF87_07990 [Acidobacteria bacterium]|nr:MAG: hypothetical protein DMF87_07990 [Acidobacteriota bacterium]